MEAFCIQKHILFSKLYGCRRGKTGVPVYYYLQMSRMAYLQMTQINIDGPRLPHDGLFANDTC